MTLPVSGPLSFSDINLELAKILQPGRLADAPINFNEADVRWLANKVAAGEQVTIPGDFYGKGYFNVVPNSTTADEGPVPTTPPPITTTTAVPTTTTAEPPSGVITVTPFLWTWTISPPAPPPTTTTAAPPTTTTAAPTTTTTAAPPPSCPPAGTVIWSGCEGIMYATYYADGSCGQTVTYESSSGCGGS